MARIKAVLRRASALPRRAPMAGRNLRFDGWTLDVDRHQLTDPEGVEVSLSTAEYRLLLAFPEHAGRVLSQDQLMDLTQGREADAFDRSIDNHVSRLRRKMDPDARHPRLIKTIWGGGYQIADVEGQRNDYAQTYRRATRAAAGGRAAGCPGHDHLDSGR